MRGRVGPGGRCYALSLLQMVWVCSCIAGNRAPTVSPGDRAREKKRSGRGRVSQALLLQDTPSTLEANPAFRLPFINYAARCRHAGMCWATRGPHPLPPPLLSLASATCFVLGYLLPAGPLSSPKLQLKATFRGTLLITSLLSLRPLRSCHRPCSSDMILPDLHSLVSGSHGGSPQRGQKPCLSCS